MPQLKLLDILTNDWDQARGLMFRDQIPSDCGMLFVYSQPRNLEFWMMNTSIPLDIIYIGPDLRVNEVAMLEPFNLERVVSRYPSVMALEVNRGTADELGISVGDRMTLDGSRLVISFESSTEAIHEAG